MARLNIGWVHIRGAPGSVRFGAATYLPPEGATEVVVEVVRYGGDVLAASVNVVSEDGTAVAGVHYTAINQLLTWEDGEIGSKYITVPINTVYGSNLTFLLHLEDPYVVVLGSPSTTEIVLDALPFGIVELENTLYTVDRGDPFSFGIIRTAPFEGSVTVNWSIDISGATPASGSQTFTDADIITKYVEVQTPTNAVDGVITITLGATDGTQLGSNTTATVDVLTYSAGFSPSSYSESFGASEVVLTVVRSGGTSPLVLRWTTDVGTTGLLSWAEGDVSTKTITLDAETETYDSNVFGVVLTKESGPTVVDISPDTATVTLGVLELTSRLYSAYVLESMAAGNASVGDMHSFSIEAESVDTSNAEITSILLHTTLTSYGDWPPEEIDTTNAEVTSIVLNTILLSYTDGVPEEIDTLMLQ